MVVGLKLINTVKVDPTCNMKSNISQMYMFLPLSLLSLFIDRLICLTSTSLSTSI